MVSNIFISLYLAIIFLSFLFRGSFFQWEQTIFSFIMLIMFILWILKKSFYKEWDGFKLYLHDVFFILIIIGYGISLINPVDVMGSWKELYLIIIYLLIYIMGRDLFNGKQNVFIGSVIGMTGIISIIGLLGYFGVNLPFDALYEGKRIGSVLQYPNTLAVINIVGILLANRLILWGNSIFGRVLSFVLLFINVITFILTVSRGGFLIYLLIMLLSILILPWKNKLSFIIYNGLSVGIGILFISRIANSVEQVALGLEYLGLAILLGMFFFIITDLIINRIPSKQQIGASFSLIGLGVFALYFIQSMQLIPERIINRIQDINLQTINVRLRLDFFEAAWKIIMDYPLGIGGEGWASIYYDYMPYFIIAREVHSHPLQIGVEAGYIGMISFLLFGLSIFFLFMRGYFIEKSNQRFNFLILGLSFLAIFLHSMIDFNLSYTSMAFLFYGMASLAPTWPLNIKHFSMNIKPAYKILPLIIVSVFLLYGLGTMTVGSYYQDKGEDILAEGNINAAVISFEKAVKWIPEDSMSLLYISMFKEGLTHDEKNILLEQAYKYNQYKPEIIHYYIKEKMELKEYSKAFELAVPLVKRQPLGENFKLFFESGRYSIRNAIFNEDKALLRKYSKWVLDILPLLEQHHYKLREVDSLVIGQAYYFNQEWEKAEKQFMEAAENSFIRVESKMWLILIYEHRGELSKRDELLKNPLLRFLPKSDIFLHLKQIN